MQWNRRFVPERHAWGEHAERTCSVTQARETDEIEASHLQQGEVRRDEGVGQRQVQPRRQRSFLPAPEPGRWEALRRIFRAVPGLDKVCLALDRQQPRFG